MVTVLREGGLSVRTYTDDHPPPHVHVIGDGEAKVALGSGDAIPEVVSVAGASRRESARALDLVRANAPLLRRRWSEIHG